VAFMVCECNAAEKEKGLRFEMKIDIVPIVKANIIVETLNPY
jgi:hypothetical protein